MKLTIDDYDVFTSPLQGTRYTCTSCHERSQKVYRLRGTAREGAKIGMEFSWLCPDCFRKIIKGREQVQFT